MYCEKCGSEIKEGEKFCNNCGNQINQNGITSENTSSTLENETITNDNINNNENLNVETEKKIIEKNPKNKNSSSIIIILIILIILGGGIYYFLTKDNGNKDNEINDDKTNVEDKNDKDNNDNNDNSNNIVDNDNKDNNQNKEQNIVDNNSNLLKKYEEFQEFVNANEPIRTTEISIESGNVNMKIDENKNIVLSCTNNICQNKTISLDGKKSKYIGYAEMGMGDQVLMAVLTEDNDIYILELHTSDFSISSKKVESNYKFKDMAIVSFRYGNAVDSLLMSIKGIPISKHATLYGITEDNKYYGEIIFDKIPIEKISTKMIEEDYYSGNNLLIYKDGKLKYINSLENRKVYAGCNHNIDCESKILSNKDVVDINGNKIYAKIVFTSLDNNIYIVSLENKIYKLTNTLKNENYVAEEYNKSIIKNTEFQNNYDASYGVNNSKIIITYEDNQTNKFEIYQGNIKVMKNK